MSWSVAIPAVPEDEFEKALDDIALPDYAKTSDTEREWQEQLDGAKAAALALFHSGALGHGGMFHAALNGHANPEHEARDGYSNDFVNLAMYREPSKS